MIFGGRRIDDLSYEQIRRIRGREIGMVFQDLALWPHLSCRDHLRFVAPGSDPTELLAALSLTERAGARTSGTAGRRSCRDSWPTW